MEYFDVAGPLSTVRVELAERLREVFPGTDRALFFRTGSCATTAAVRLARVHTGRRRVLTSGFHGWHDWQLQYSPHLALPDRDPDTADFGYDLSLFANLARSGDVAAVILTPEVNVFPHKYARELEKLARAHGALVIVDEVMTGFRYAPGGYAYAAGMRPDLVTVSKGLANGTALSAVLGRDDVMQAQESTYLGGTFQREVTPFAVALATRDAYERESSAERINQIGSLLMDGLNDVFAEFDVPAWCFREPAMFDMVFAHAHQGKQFCARMWGHGYLMQYGDDSYHRQPIPPTTFARPSLPRENHCSPATVGQISRTWWSLLAKTSPRPQQRLPAGRPIPDDSDSRRRVGCRRFADECLRMAGTILIRVFAAHSSMVERRLGPMALSIADSFSGGSRYLDTTNYGLLPNTAIEQIKRATVALGDGSFETKIRDAALESSRTRFAQLMDVDSSSVAVGASASSFVGLVANSVPDRSTVLLVEDDFTSLTLPFIVQRDRLNIVTVSLHEFTQAITRSVDVAVVSAVQSADGAVIDLSALAQARIDYDVEVVLDVTQAAGWLPIQADQYDVAIAAAYKWLLCPRGVSFGYFAPDMTEKIRPIFAGWYATENIHTGYYGTDVELATSARKFDVSPSGLNWIGAEPTLELLLTQGVAEIQQHNINLANNFRQEIGLPESNSAIVALPVDLETIAQLKSEGITFGVQEGKRAGYGRFSFHLYNTIEDVMTAASCFRR
jgi:selenocysteine lyase/cysteine desulfurase